MNMQVVCHRLFGYVRSRNFHHQVSFFFLIQLLLTVLYRYWGRRRFFSFGLRLISFQTPSFPFGVSLWLPGAWGSL
jgi:uncharacterized membrane protein